eukprot:15434494-Alexandrium_andersonii.AAC.1
MSQPFARGWSHGSGSGLRSDLDWVWSGWDWCDCLSWGWVWPIRDSGRAGWVETGMGFSGVRWGSV